MSARLGQHFLTRTETAEKITDAYSLTKKDVVLEVGPGHGILTRALLARVKKVYALEKDPVLFKELLCTFAKEVAEERLVLLSGDIRDFDPTVQVPERYRVVANIPYYLSGYIVRLFLSAEHQPESMTLLVQKEVAERICARGGKESVLSLSVKVYGKPRIAFVVKAGAFSPPPKVDSAVVVVEHISRERFLNKTHEERFFTLLHTAFQGKRKMVGSTLKGKVSEETFLKHHLSPRLRPEEVRVEEWCLLARNVG